MSVLPFCYAILLGSVWTRDTMANALVRNVVRQTTVLSTPVRMEGTNFGIKKAFNMFLKQVKSMLDIRLALEEIDPSITTEIIQEAHIIFKTSHK
jgi:hypothetical protein